MGSGGFAVGSDRSNARPTLSHGVAWMFPGQGSQTVGMGQALAASRGEARDAYAQADEALGFAISELCWHGPELELTRTANQQPAMVATSVAMLRVLQSDNKLPEPDYVAGHSLGEYSALVAAGALDFADALRLVRRRGQLMEQIARGGMLAVMGLDEETLQIVANESGAEIANFNAPGQTTISGSDDAIAVAEMSAKARGARRVVRLPVNGAFHSSLMRPVADELAADIARMTVVKPHVPLISNVSAEPIVHPDDIRRELVEQITASVQWTRSVQTMVELGVTHFYEVGPGNVLSGLVGRIDKSVLIMVAEKLLAQESARSGSGGGRH
jgi:[acyl-carrier-protein] S-malonyltransferase